jgi:T-complex protein 1 subunit theta
VCSTRARARVCATVTGDADDGVNVFKLLCRDGRLVAGGGATELELARLLSREAGKVPGLAQYAMQQFAESLEVVAATLAETVGLDATKTVSDLYAAHEAAGGASMGVDVESGALADMAATGVFDHLLAKRSAIQLATDAALTILKVDQIIMARRAGGPKAPQQGSRDADD